jgi:hypothetical protein
MGWAVRVRRAMSVHGEGVCSGRSLLASLLASEAAWVGRDQDPFASLLAGEAAAAMADSGAAVMTVWVVPVMGPAHGQCWQHLLWNRLLHRRVFVQTVGAEHPLVSL